MKFTQVSVVAFCCLCIIGVYSDSSPTDYMLPSNATVVNGGPIITGFSCDGLRYGYYADIPNGCRVFHVCYPYQTTDGFTVTRMFSFICGLNTVFNQKALVCAHPRDSIPCEDSADYYKVNDYFGRTDVNFRE